MHLPNGATIDARTSTGSTSKVIVQILRSAPIAQKYFTKVSCVTQCGHSGSDGEHFWVTASYARLLTGYTIADFGAECLVGMLIFTPVVAAIACATRRNLALGIEQ
jgi:hypothetical protein